MPQPAMAAGWGQPGPAHMKTGYLSFYRDRRVMVTGGLGFIGSNLARQLVDAGADVLIVDSLIPITAATCSTSTASRIASGSTSPTCATRRRWTRWCATARSSSTSPARSATSTACAIRTRTSTSIAARSCRCSRPAASTTRRSASSTRARARSTAGPTDCRSTRATSCGRPTSTASTRRRASTTTCSTTTSSACARARCG